MVIIREIYPSISQAEFALELVSNKTTIWDYEITSRASIEKYFSQYNYKIFKNGLIKVMFTSSLYTFFIVYLLCLMLISFFEEIRFYVVSSIFIALIASILVTTISCILYVLTRRNASEVKECGLQGEEALLVVKVADEDVIETQKILKNV